MSEEQPDRRTRRAVETDPKTAAENKGSSRMALTVVLVLVLGLVAIGAGGLVWVQQNLNSARERIGDPFAALPSRPTQATSSPGATEVPTEPPVTTLVLGSDSRISAGDPSQWSFGAQRTDAIMIVQVSGDRQDAFVMSIPRDSWVNVPGYGMAKINAAFSYGGPTLMIQTVEELTGIYIDHFAVTDFKSFSTITDALGGVSMYLPNGLNGDGVSVAPGQQTLTWDQALVYVRQRYNLSGGDFSRVQRQQNWMRSIMAAVFDQGILKDLGKLTDFVQTVAKSVAVDEGLTVPQMVDLGHSVRDLRGEDITFMTVPYAGTGWSPDGRQSIVLLDEAKSQALFQAFATDTVRQYLFENPDGAVILGPDPE